jgi:hypothetical protein
VRNAPWINDAAMDWADYEFIADVPPEEQIEPPPHLTGWEMVVFELEDLDKAESRKQKAEVREE